MPIRICINTQSLGTRSIAARWMSLHGEMATLVLIVGGVVLMMSPTDIYAGETNVTQKTHHEEWHHTSTGETAVVCDYTFGADVHRGEDMSLFVAVTNSVVRQTYIFPGEQAEFALSENPVRSIDIAFADGTVI